MLAVWLKRSRLQAFFAFMAFFDICHKWEAGETAVRNDDRSGYEVPELPWTARSLYRFVFLIRQQQY